MGAQLKDVMSPRRGVLEPEEGNHYYGARNLKSGGNFPACAGTILLSAMSKQNTGKADMLDGDSGWLQKANAEGRGDRARGLIGTPTRSGSLEKQEVKGPIWGEN